MTTENIQTGENVAADIVEIEQNVTKQEIDDIELLEDGEIVESAPVSEPIEEESEVEEEVEEKVEVREKPKKKGGYVKKLEAKDAEIEYWKQVALDKQKANNSQEVTEQDSDREPDLSEFDDYYAWDAAREAWRKTQNEKMIERQVEQKLAAKEAKIKEQEIENNFRRQVEEAKNKYDDFAEVVSTLDGMVSKEFFNESIKSDKAAEIAYYLGQNYEQYADVLESNNIGAINRLLGKLEAKLEQPKNISKPVVKVTKALPPITPVKGNAPASVSLEDLDTDAFIEARNRKR